MNLRFLGTGTSCGVPQIGCTCAVCRSTDVRDSRLRTSALVTTDSGQHILIDCGPDFRQQMLHVPFVPLDAVLITHEHYDHVGGLDDLRPFCANGDVHIYADAYTTEHIKERMPYCFVEHKYPGVPQLVMHQVSPLHPFCVGTEQVLPLEVVHGKMPILGFRIGTLGYVTDMSWMPESSFEALKGVRTLVINALRKSPHPSHQSLSQALDFVRRVQPRETYLIHMSHQMGLHAQVEAQLPPHVHLAYDGLSITC